MTRTRDDNSAAIEFLDPDDNMFSATDSAAFADPARHGDERRPIQDEPSARPRWVVPAGLAALAAVVVVSVTTGDSGTDSARPPATTMRPASTAPITLAPLPASVQVDDESPPQYVVDMPDDFRVQGTREYVNNGSISPSQLWATPGSTATTGRWIKVSAYGTFGAPLTATTDSYRILVGDSLGMVSPGLRQRESTTLSFVRENTGYTIEAHGVTLEFLLALAGSVSLTDERALQIDSSLGLFDEFRLIAEDEAGAWLTGAGPVAQLFAQFGDQRSFAPNRSNFLSVSVGRPDGTYEAQLPFIVDPIKVFRAVDGSLGIAGPIVNLGARYERQVSSAHWIDANGWMVVIVMDASVGRVIEVASTARVDDEERQRLATEAAVDDGRNFAIPTTGTTFAVPGVDSRIEEAALQLWGSSQTYVWSTFSGDATQPDRSISVESHPFAPYQPTISTTATLDNQFVMATVPRDLAGATLTVTVGDDPPVVVPLTDRDPTFEVLSAAYATTTLGPVVAVITGADGGVLATWPAL